MPRPTGNNPILFGRRSDTALVLVGHGSTKNPSSGASTRKHAKAIADLELFKSVHVGFLKEAPTLDGLLDGIEARSIFVVPNMASSGYLTNELIPSALQLTGRVSERISPTGRSRVYLCDPIGTHPALMDAMAQTVRSVAISNGLDADETAAFVCGHGNPRNPENALQTERAAEQVRNTAIAHEVSLGFLEEAPFIKDWRTALKAKNIIVSPFLIAGGLHGAEDIPNLMGIDPNDPGLGRLEDGAPAAGPFTVDGRTLWYCRPVGLDPIVVDVILSRVDGAEADAL